jgi:hypothetical protein
MTRFSVLPRSVLGALGAVAMLSACSGGSQSGVSPTSGVMPNGVHSANQAMVGKVSPAWFNGAANAHRNTGKSWSKVAPNSTLALLYVTDPGSGTVEFYDYARGHVSSLQGTLTGFSYPGQPCVDKAGDVFIPDYALGTVTEFAHGGTTPIQTLTDTFGGPTGCSIDNSTGNLAAANFGKGSVSVWAGAMGTPTAFDWSHTTPNPEYVAYDGSGDLFIEGQTSAGGGGVLGELKKGRKSITTLELNGFNITYAGSLQWGGTFLLVGDQGTPGTGPSSVHQAIVSAKLVTSYSTLTFPESIDVTGYWKYGSVPNADIIGADYGARNVQVDEFPHMFLRTDVTDGVTDPFGAVVSK